MKTVAARYGLTIGTLHTHIGSGTDPEVWKRAMRMTLDLVAQFPDVAAVNLGGGFKVGRMPEEPSVDMDEVAAHVRSELEAFGRVTPGRAVAVRMNPGLGSGSTKRTNAVPLRASGSGTTMGLR